MEVDELRQQLLQLSTCDVADALDALGHREQTALGLTRLWDDCPRLAGRVMPLLLGPERQGSTAIGTLEAIEACEPGDVLVFDNGGRLDRNAFGSIAAFCAAQVGIVGAVIDGVTRDLDDMRAQDFPVYARGVTTTSVRGRTGLAGYGVPVQCGGVAVSPGDWVVADGSGVIFIPAGLATRVAELGPRYQAFEREVRHAILAGGGFVEVHTRLRYEHFEARGPGRDA